MAKIINTYKQSVPAMRFIGRNDPLKGRGWGDGATWTALGEIEKAAGGSEVINGFFEDAGAYIGFLHLDQDLKLLGYWIGIFVPADTQVPEGLDYFDFSPQNFGVAWIQGKDMSDIGKQFGKVIEHLQAAGMEIVLQNDGSRFQFERYPCPRYTTPDENGNIICDYCFFVK
ncbi:MAG TPA: hypothetical protein DDZ89_07775 [Clostridiales bacterium]|nr:hypothetical protein [Clostridiales bacterium]